MTFYEAALEVLRSSGSPLSSAAITAEALSKDLLSHTGRLPEAIMASRLHAMVGQEAPMELIVPEEGLYALRDWGLDHDAEAAALVAADEEHDDGPSLRSRERVPMPLSDVKAAQQAERSGRWEQIETDVRRLGERRRRKPVQGETPLQALLAMMVEVGGGPVDLQYVVDAIPRQEQLPEGFPTDLEGVRALVEAENSRSSSLGLGATFFLEQDQVFLAPADRPKGPAQDSRPRRSASRDQQILRSLSGEFRRLKDEAFEGMLRLLASRFGVNDLRSAAKHSKGLMLFTGTMPLGAAKVKVAVGIVPDGKDLRDEDVLRFQEGLELESLRLGALVSTGKVSSGARAALEAEKTPIVMPFGATELAELCLRHGVGVQVVVEERPSLDPAVFDLVKAAL